MKERAGFAGMELIGLRSPHLLEKVCAAVRTGGGRATALATHHVRIIEDCPAALELLKNPGATDWTLFSSPNAAGALGAIAARNSLPLDPDMPVAAPGQQTARTLARAGFRSIVAPKQEAGLAALLASGALGDLAGRKVAVVQRQAAPPRTLEALRRRQAAALAIECYHRIRAAEDMWSSLQQEVRTGCNCLLAFDEASLALLLARAGDDAPRLKRLPLGVHHPQIEAKARNLGFENIITQSNPTELLAELAERIYQDAERKPISER